MNSGSFCVYGPFVRVDEAITNPPLLVVASSLFTRGERQSTQKEVIAMMTIAPQTSEGSGSKGFFNEATSKLKAALQWARAMASRGFTAVVGRLKAAFSWLKGALAKPLSIGTVVAPFVLATKTGYNTVVNVIGKVGGWFSRAISWVGRKIKTVANVVLGWASEAPGFVGDFFAKAKEIFNTGASYVERGWTALKDFGSALLYSAKNNSFVGTVTRGVALAVGCGAALLTAGVAVPFIAPFVLGFGGIATIATTGTIASVAGTVELIQGTSAQNETVPVQEKATESPKPEAKKPVPAPAKTKKETVDGGLEDLNANLTFIKVEKGDVIKDKDGQPALIVPVQVVVDLDAMVSAKHAEADAVIKSAAESINEAAEAIVTHKPTPGPVGQPRAERTINGVTYTRGVNSDGSKFQETRAQFDARIALIEAGAASQASA